MALPYPLDCPQRDWENNRLSSIPAQVAALLGHLEQAHGDGIPQPVRDGLKACKHELEKLAV